MFLLLRNESHLLSSVNHLGAWDWWAKWIKYRRMKAQQHPCSVNLCCCRRRKGQKREQPRKWAVNQPTAARSLANKCHASISSLNEQWQWSRRVTLQLLSPREPSTSIHTTWTKAKLVPGRLSWGFFLGWGGWGSGALSAEWLPCELYHRPRLDISACLFNHLLISSAATGWSH